MILLLISTYFSNLSFKLSGSFSLIYPLKLSNIPFENFVNFSFISIKLLYINEIFSSFISLLCFNKELLQISLTDILFEKNFYGKNQILGIFEYIYINLK